MDHALAAGESETAVASIQYCEYCKKSVAKKSRVPSPHPKFLGGKKDSELESKEQASKQATSCQRIMPSSKARRVKSLAEQIAELDDPAPKGPSTFVFTICAARVTDHTYVQTSIPKM